MKIEQIDPAKLLAADYNPRQIDAHQLEALKRSIGRWGFVEPVIVNKRSGTIVGGHQRTKAALELAMDKVPVTYVDLDDDAEKALNIALNKIAGEWDEDKLAGLLADLEKGGQEPTNSTSCSRASKVRAPNSKATLTRCQSLLPCR